MSTNKFHKGQRVEVCYADYKFDPPKLKWRLGVVLGNVHSESGCIWVKMDHSAYRSEPRREFVRPASVLDQLSWEISRPG